MARYRSKPRAIEAEQYFDLGPLPNGVCTSPSCPAGGHERPHVHTIHDGQAVFLEHGDFVVAEPDGAHYYPVKPDIFADRYELDLS